MSRHFNRSGFRTKNDLNASLGHLGAPETTEIEPELYIRKRVCGFYR